MEHRRFRRWGLQLVLHQRPVQALEKDYTFARSGLYSDTHYRYYNTYIQLPVMVKFMFGSEKVHGFSNVGVYAGYWAASRIKGQDTQLERALQYITTGN